MDAQLHDFLRRPQWITARPLLVQYADKLPAHVARMASAHENSMTLDMLVAALRQIAKKQPAPPAVKARPAPTVKKPTETTRLEYTLPPEADLPDDLRKLRGNVISWLRMQQDLRGRLRELAYSPGDHEETMYNHARKIIETEAQLQLAYERFDYYTNHGQYMPGTAPMSKQDRLVHLLSRKRNNREYIRKFGESPDPAKMKQTALRKAELEELEILLNENKGN